MKKKSPLVAAMAVLATLLFPNLAANAHEGHTAEAECDGVVEIGDLAISGAFTRATLPSAPVGGGYLTITNSGAEADRLIAAFSPAATETQIHEMSMDGDVMRMAELPDGIEIPAGGTVTLAPGGLHLMFMGLGEGFVEGATVPVTLTFEKAGSIDLTLAVAGIAADMPADHMH